MKFLILLLAVASVTHSKVLQVPDNHTAYGYLKTSIERAEELRKAEEAFLTKSRIVGGVPAGLGQYPYQAGLLIDIIGFEGRGVCGGSLVSPNRVITAAHCWFDGLHQGWRIEVILGTVTLFTGGHRQLTSAVASHPTYFPLLVRNDVAVIYLASNVPYSNTIGPIALPTGPELQEDFDGLNAFASGFGITEDGGGISTDQFLSHVQLRILSNAVCRIGFPLVLQDSNICTSGIGGVGTCRGDSGGPLVIIRNNRPILVGVTSFGIALGCQVNFPAAYARVTSFIDFFNQNL